MHALLQRRIGDLGRRQADALIDHLETGIARPDGDLLGAVGMAVEAGLAHQHLEPPAEPGETRSTASRTGARLVPPPMVAARPTPVGRAVLAIDLAQAPRPIRRW